MVGAAAASSAGKPEPAAGPPTYAPGSTVKVCQLTGETDNETGKPTSSRTESRFGLVAGDRGYSFDYRGRVWWIFGDSRPTTTFDGKPNAATRFPGDKTGIDNDSLASSAPTPPGRCPLLDFVREAKPVPRAYANPSAELHGVRIDLRTNETPVSGLQVGRLMYVTVATDNPQDVGLPSNCAPRTGKTACFGHDTRSVMTVLAAPGTASFHGLYNLSAPPEPYAEGAIFEQNAMQRDGAYVYVWGPEGGTKSRMSAPYLARVKASRLSTGRGITYFHGYTKRGAPIFDAGQASAVALFHDSPDCTGELGVEYDRYVGRWLMLYNCTDNTTAHPKGIWMRSATAPWGPWSAPQTIFSPSRDKGYCYFIHFQGKCPKGAPNPGKGQTGGNYGPYFVQDWTTGTRATGKKPATTTIYYTVDTFVPYGQVLVKSTLTRG